MAVLPLAPLVDETRKVSGEEESMKDHLSPSQSSLRFVFPAREQLPTQRAGGSPRPQANLSAQACGVASDFGLIRTLRGWDGIRELSFLLTLHKALEYGIRRPVGFNAARDDLGGCRLRGPCRASCRAFGPGFRNGIGRAFVLIGVFWTSGSTSLSATTSTCGRARPLTLSCPLLQTHSPRWS